jgi:hypothetical protein
MEHSDRAVSGTNGLQPLKHSGPGFDFHSRHACLCAFIQFMIMMSSGMLRRVALERTDVSEEHSGSIFRVTRLVFLRSVRRLLVTANVVPSSPILVTLMIEALSSFETLVPTRATPRNIPEDAILHSRRRENLKSYIFRLCCPLYRQRTGVGLIPHPKGPTDSRAVVFLGDT